MNYKQYTPVELANESDKRNGTNQIKVGDHVRLRNSEDYLGKVVDEKVLRFLIIRDSKGNQYGASDDGLELAPRLRPDEAWAELPYLVLAKINSYMSWGAVRLHDTHQRAIRSECYKLLGGAGIKVTDEVKERVRKAIKRMADAMGLELA